MGASIPPEKDYSPDNPFAGGKQYSADNPFRTAAPHLPTKLELAKRNAAEPHPEDMETEDPSYAQQALGGIASLAHDIPGAEAAQAGARSLVRGQSYTDALSDVRGAENSANKWVRRGNNLVGGTIAAAATPGSNVALQGARFGIAEALGGADPESLKARIDKIPARAAIDAAAGKVFGEIVPNAARTVAAKSLGKNVLERTGAMEAADIPAYGKAKAEGDLAAANPTPQAVSDALNDTDIKPYVAVIRGSGLFKNADDPTVLREAYKLMTERQKMLGSRIANSDDFKAGSELEQNEIKAGKRKLLNVGDQIMPSLRPAVYQHAEAAGDLDALKSGADATGRIVRGADVSGKKLAQNSPEAFLKSILSMRESQAKAATEGVLGKLKARSALSLNPLKGFGIPKTAASISKASPFIRALDSRSTMGIPRSVPLIGGKRMPTSTIPDILRAAGIVLPDELTP